MSDLFARDRHDPEWGATVIDLVEDDRVVGIVYADDGGIYAEFYPDQDDGAPWVFDVADLQRVLDTAAAMLADPEADAPAAGDPAADPVAALAADPVAALAADPVAALAAEFDPLAARRGPEDEGFYPLPVAARLIGACSALSLAVVFLEGFTLHADFEDAIAGCRSDLGSAYEGEPWPGFLAGCNTQAMALLERWPRRANVGVALEIQDSAGERYVL